MKYLKLFEDIDKYDDSDSMARFALFDADAEMSFEYNRKIVSNITDISELILKYNETYISEKEWFGGPTNRVFDKYFQSKFNTSVDGRINKPIIVIKIKVHDDLGNIRLGFSLRSKKCVLIDRDINIHPGSNSEETLSIKKKIMSMSREIFNKNEKMDDVIEDLQLNIKNKIEWEWKGPTDI
jgi:hypothetical protein